MAWTTKALVAVAGAAACVAGATAAWAAPTGAPPPTVVASALPGSVVVIQQCSGEVVTQKSGALLKVERPNATSGTISVDVSYSGSLVGTPDLGPLPDPVEIPAGQDATVIPVEATAPGDVTLTIEPGSGYTVGDPASATADVVADGGGFGCQDLTEETIEVGSQPTPYPVYDRFGFGVGDSTLVIHGQVPPGLTYQVDGTWTGAATTVGTYEFTACYQVGDICGLELPFRITVVEESAVAKPSSPAPAAPVRSSATYTG